MFSFVRWISAGSFVLVMISVFMFGQQFKKVASEDLAAIIHNSNVSVARNLETTVWKRYHDHIHAGLGWYNRFKASGVPAEQWKNYNGFQDMEKEFSVLGDMARDVFKLLEDTPIAEINIYTPEGIRIVSVDQSHKLETLDVHALSKAMRINVQEDSDFSVALAGKVISGALPNQEYHHPDGSVGRGVLVRTVYPVFEENGSPTPSGVVVNCAPTGKSDVECKDAGEKRPLDVVIGVRYDANQQWSQLDMFYHISVYGVMGLFSVIILVLLFTSGRAESIIAKQHEANLELAAQAASAKAENRDKSQFLANVSHELRTPLNAIIGFSEFIKSERSGKIGNEKYAEYIRDIHGSGVHLLSLINDILDYSKAEADKLELDLSEVDATKLVKNSMRLVSPRAENAQVQLVEEVPREHFILETDAKKLKQVLLNLLSNAVKFTPSGGSVTVTMWQVVTDGSVVIEVKDTGIGIAPKDISRAMAPFGQVDNALSRKYEGTGLGLPLTRKFVEIMGGTFNIASEVGKGTTITITLPKAPAGKASATPQVDAKVADRAGEEKKLPEKAQNDLLPSGKEYELSISQPTSPAQIHHPDTDGQG